MIKFLNLGLQPLANSYLKKKDLNKKEKKFKLIAGFDKKSFLVSITNTVLKERMFNDQYPYKSSESNTMQKSFEKLSQKIKKKFNPSLVLEIGSNDGAFLGNFNKNKIIGIEPCKNLAKITKKKGFQTISDYWSTKLAKKIVKRKKFDLIYSANTLSHIKNLKEIFKAIELSLNDDGILILEDPSLLECIKNLAYDQFYCEHIYIFSTIAIKKILSQFNLEIFDIESIPTHGGSNRYYIKKISNKKFQITKNVLLNIEQEIKYGLKNINTYKKFAEKVKKSKKKLTDIFLKLKKENKRIIGYGATAKSCTVLNFCGLGKKEIDFFYDTTSFKIGKYLPGTKIPIRKYKKLNLKDYDYVFLGAWNFKKEIFNKEKQFIKKGGRFITHVPFPKVI